MRWRERRRRRVTRSHRMGGRNGTRRRKSWTRGRRMRIPKRVQRGDLKLLVLGILCRQAGRDRCRVCASTSCRLGRIDPRMRRDQSRAEFRDSMGSGLAFRVPESICCRLPGINLREGCGWNKHESQIIRGSDLRSIWGSDGQLPDWPARSNGGCGSKIGVQKHAGFCCHLLRVTLGLSRAECNCTRNIRKLWGPGARV